MRRLRARTGVGLVALVLGMSFASAAAFAQFGSYYANDRKLDDNGSVYEPNSGPSANVSASASENTSARPRSRRRHLTNYAPRIQPVSQTQRQYWPNDRKPDDNGSVDEPGAGRQ